MKEYRININSINRSFAFGIPLFGLFIIGMIQIMDRTSGFLVVLYFAISLGTIYWLVNRLSLGSIEVHLDNDVMRIRWLKKFIMSKEADYTINLNEIIHFSYQEVNNFEWYKFTLTKNRQIVFNRFDFPLTKKVDDFARFVQDIPEFLRNNMDTNQTPITEGPTIYDDRIFRWALYLMTGVTIYFVFDYLLNPDSAFLLPKLLFISFNILFYWLRYRRVKN